MCEVLGIMNNNETNLTMPERIRNIVCDAGFMEFCAREAEKNQFVKYFDTYLKLARINTANERVNKDMFNMYLSPPQVEAATIEFYEWLDSVCPSKPLAPQVKENMKYVTYDFNRIPDRVKGEHPRAGCGHVIENNEMVDAWIFLEDKADIRDALSSTHEHMHALSKHFTTGKPYKDATMGELLTLIVDELTLCFLEQKTGNKQLAQEIRKSHVVLQVEKAKRSVLDCLILNVMKQNCSPQEKLQQLNALQQQYGSIISEKDLADCVRQIENKKYEPLFEARYIFAQLAAMQIGDRFQQIMYYKQHGTPDQVELAKAEEFRIISTVKDILEKDTEISLDQALDMLCLPPKEVLVDNYQFRLSGKGM